MWCCGQHWFHELRAAEVPGKLFKLLADADTRAALLLLTAPSIDGLLQASAQQQVHPTTESQTSPMPQPLPANKTTSAGTSEEQHESTASDHSFSACQWVLQRLASNQGAAPEQEACDVLPSPWLTSALASIPATTIQAARNRLQEQCRQQHSAPQASSILLHPECRLASIALGNRQHHAGLLNSFIQL
jgi:hypothetical protein